MSPNNFLSSLLFLSPALLASALPQGLPSADASLALRDTKYNTPLCGNLPKTVRGWKDDRAPWMKSDATDWPFCASRWDSGRHIVGIAAFKEDWQGNCDGKGAITRLEVRYDDQQQVVIGTENKKCPAGSFGIASDEFFTLIEAQKAGDRPSAAGKIHIKTAVNGQQKQETWLKGEGKTGNDVWSQDVAGGMLIGLSGYMVSDALTSIAFQFTPGKPKSVERSGFVYDKKDLDAYSLSSNVVQLTSGNDCNPGNSTSHYTIANTESVTSSLTVTNTHSFTAGLEISQSGEIGIPGVAKYTFGEKLHFDYTYTTASALAKTDSKTVGWTRVVDEQPNTIYECTMTCAKASGPLPYKANITIYFDDNSSPYTFVEEGQVTGDVFSRNADSVCVPRPIDWKNSTDAALCGGGHKASNVPVPDDAGSSDGSDSP